MVICIMNIHDRSTTPHDHYISSHIATRKGRVWRKDTVPKVAPRHALIDTIVAYLMSTPKFSNVASTSHMQFIMWRERIATRMIQNTCEDAAFINKCMLGKHRKYGIKPATTKNTQEDKTQNKEMITNI
jgi:hypothetical protein